MRSAKGAGRVVLRRLGWAADEDVSKTRWLVEAAVLFMLWQGYAVGAIKPAWFALPVACLASAIYGVSWTSRIRNGFRRSRGGRHRADDDSP
ncbi:hypothetical protein [Streptomyces sp. NPDC050704]|uniref:hypothetical protein n=1 Tax=Streptomyces sp. NPDC050704 TaxID=3157219 RepID=UPI0034345B6F